MVPHLAKPNMADSRPAILASELVFQPKSLMAHLPAAAEPHSETGSLPSLRLVNTNTNDTNTQTHGYRNLYLNILSIQQLSTGELLAVQY